MIPLGLNSIGQIHPKHNPSNFRSVVPEKSIAFKVDEVITREILAQAVQILTFTVYILHLVLCYISLFSNAKHFTEQILKPH